MSIMNDVHFGDRSYNIVSKDGRMQNHIRYVVPEAANTHVRTRLPFSWL